VIPQSFGRRLFEAANEPKEGFWPKMAGHNSIFDLGGFGTAAEFIERRVSR
jgi:ABC-type sulfate transport system substrate-binding protein